MTKHLVLIFAYHFPPENAIGAARPFRFAKYLSRMGYDCRVFTAAKQTGCDDPNTEYVPDPFVAHPRRGLEWQLERAVRKFFMPGELGTQWSYHAARAARAHIRAHPANNITIFSTYPPLGPHFAAWQLARKDGFPWIADFRDPFADERINKETNPFRKRMFRWLERSLTRRASAVIANTDAAMAKWQENFPTLTDRFHLIWNGFDPEDKIEPLPVPSRDYKVLSHVGSLYHKRTVSPILESVARLISSGRISAGSIRIRLIGPVEVSCIPGPEFIHRAKAEGWLELIPQMIPQSEARQVTQTSDGQLLLQPQSGIQVPGKLFEYLQVGRPILGFIQPNSPAERLLERSGVPYRCVYPGSTPGAIDDVVASFFNISATAVEASSWFEEQFNAEHQTRTLDAIIRSLHNEPLPGTNPEAGASIDAKRAAVKENVNAF